MEIEEYVKKQIKNSKALQAVDEKVFKDNGVKIGLRDNNGQGVLVGLTNISKVEGFEMVDGVKKPCEGRLYYRGYNINDLMQGFGHKRFGFEECAYLLLFGELPNKDELKEFTDLIASCRMLPTNFTRDVIMKAPSKDIMNSITKSVLTLSSYDDKASDTSLENVLSQSIRLIAELPMLGVYGYQAHNHYDCDDSLYLHRPDPTKSTAENILMMLRPDKKYTELEARVLDAALVLHMEHGGGNNSTFTTRVVTSTGSDTYATFAASLSSLKGPKHGGANIKVMEMIDDIKKNVKDLNDEEELKEYLNKILLGQTFDHKGLIYGMGHAVYSLSDPRAQIFKTFVHDLASEKHHEDDYQLYASIEKIAPQVISNNRTIFKGVCANVDFYSGFVYSMLNIPVEMYTPVFAFARIVGWSAHRLEQLANQGKIMRPAYKSLVKPRDYIDLENRK
ncbi:MAG: citrate/2-methylcitrate synthase [Thomasclavelia sp.]|nr:citrate/2-methylcitrate synthase [Thomasclavelia sp.]